MTTIDRASSFERALTNLYVSNAPFLSAFVPVGETCPDPVGAFEKERSALAQAGASHAALDAVAARLALPAPEDVGGQAIFTDADGSAVVAFGNEGPADPYFTVGNLPYAAPVLEWKQWKVSHLVASALDDGFEIVLFEPDQPPVTHLMFDLPSASAACQELAKTYGCDLLVINGVRGSDLLRELNGHLPVNCRVVALEESDLESTTLADEVVRHAADTVARATVRALEDFRFMQTHDGAAQGAEETFDQLHRGLGNLLLIHDDPEDDRTAWFGPGARQLSLTRTDECPAEGRLVDVAIRTAILAGIDIRVIPSTGPQGPDENIGLMTTERTGGAGGLGV